MTPLRHRARWLGSTALALALGLLASAGQAQERHERGAHGGAPGLHAGPRAPVHFDGRYHHNLYYPARGYVAAALPVGAIQVGYGGGRYYFHGGAWWQPYGPRFRVVLPPVGITLGLLPPAYATLWIGGAPYYYANGVYYAPAPGGYAVVPPPAGADSAQPQARAPIEAPARPAPDPIIYPRNQQDAAQTEFDRQECNRWATTQPQALADASVFQRAVAACMDGRGYTVR